MARTKLQQNDMYKRNPDVSMGLMMALSSVNFENALSNQYSFRIFQIPKLAGRAAG
jgi:hypothetical protein